MNTTHMFCGGDCKPHICTIMYVVGTLIGRGVYYLWWEHCEGNVPSMQGEKSSRRVMIVTIV